jgi:uncharacterized protein YndB with AHSA1/START domain
VPRIEVTTVIDASPAVVWDHIADVRTHTEWMADAEAIRLSSERTEGPGTTFDCDTRVGPVVLTDRLEITEWVPGEAMGVRHTGLVTGEGRFTLVPVSGGRTRFTWAETLEFPWSMGGAVGGAVAARVLGRIWRANLDRLRVMLGG